MQGARGPLASGVARLVLLPITSICAFGTSYLVISKDGATGYAAVALVANLIQLIPFANLGVGASVQNAVSRNSGADSEDLRRVILTSLRATLVSAMILVLVVGGLAIFLDWNVLLGLHQSGTNTVMVLTALIFGASLPTGIGPAVLLGAGQAHRAVLSSGLASVVSLAFTFILININTPIMYLALAVPTGLLFSNSVALAQSRKYIAHGILARAVQDVWRIRAVRGTTIVNSALPMLVITLGLPIALHSDRLILSHLAGTSAVAQYSLAIQLYNPLWSVVTSAAQSLWSAFARERAKGSNNRDQWQIATRNFVAIGVLLGFLILVAAQNIGDLLSQNKIHIPISLASGFGVLLVVQTAQYVTGMLLTEPKQLRFQAKCVTAMLLLNFPLSILLTAQMGPAGPVWASAISILLVQYVPGIFRAIEFTKATWETQNRGGEWEATMPLRNIRSGS